MLCQNAEANQRAFGESKDGQEHIYLQSLRIIVNRAFAKDPDVKFQANELIDSPHEEWPKGLAGLRDLISRHLR